MNGQGSPQFGSQRKLRRLTMRAIAWLTWMAVLLLARQATAAELDIRLRIAWGGGESCSWQGTIRLSEGVLAEVVPLGLEADDPGSMQLEGDTVVRVHPRSPRSYDGCDLRVKAPAAAKLLIEFAPAGQPPAAPLEVPLAQVVKGFAQFPLDAGQNRLLIQRSPGDALAVKLPRDSLVFSPSEALELEVLPNPADVAPGATYLLAASLLVGRSDEQLWNLDQDLKTDDAGRAPAPLAVKIPLPAEEGVYDVRLSLYPKRLTTSLVRGKPIATRKVQLVVVAPVKTVNQEIAAWETVLEFDPANPRWWERMARLPTSLRLPSLPIKPVGSATPRSRPHLERTWVELSPAAWQAYPLTVATPGQPHILEVEYPSDLEQTLGISIVEPNGAGQVGPIGLDSGIDVAAPTAGHQPAIARHRLVFWPNTREPLVLLTNRSDQRPAVFGSIKLLAGPAELPPLATPQGRFATRTLAAYYDKPLFAENFSAPEAVDPATGRTLDDWVTFHSAGRRLVQSLQYAGYNAAQITVACEGSAIYPSTLLQPTPRYDTGTFFENGQDPVRKDVLELLFRLFDREGIQLVPVVQFAAPLPQLEAIRLRGGEEAVGLEPLGPDGRTWLAGNGARRGMGVYYNALDDRVQAALAAVVGELAERYGHHPSFGGVSVQLGAESYALLPDETCSYDRVTLAAFHREADVEIPEEELASLAKCAAYLHGAGEEPWLAWRAQRLTSLFSRMKSEVQRRKAGAKLYLATGELLDARQVQLALRPALPARSDPRLVLRWMGLDFQKLAAEGIVVPRPQRIVASPVASGDFHQHWNQAAELDALFQGTGRTTAFHFLEPAPLRLPEFDAVSPFGPDKTHTWLVAQLAPAGAAARQRFVHSLAALDAPAIIDGGWLLPLGQEAELAPLAKVFRRLPAEAFSTARPNAAKELTSGVVVRLHKGSGKTFFYAVNDAPWPVELTLEFHASGPLRLTSYADDRAAVSHQDGTRHTWTVKMQPYDLVGGEIDGEEPALTDYRVTPPPDAAERLRDEVRTVRLRANALRSPPVIQALANPSFEMPLVKEAIPGWVHARGPGILVARDATEGYQSASSLHVVSRAAADAPAPVVWVRSDPFPAPTSGRLTVLAWVRLADAARQPKLRLAIEGKLDGRTYYRRANVGASEDGQPVKPLGTQWAQYRFPFPHLPQRGLTDVRVGFDLMGEGEVWIDNVQVFDLWFEENERDELLKSIATADVQASAGQLAECQHFLNSYWSNYLRRHVKLPESRLPAGAGGAPSAAAGGNAGPIAARPLRAPLPAEAGQPSAPPAANSPSMIDRMKSWLPKSWR